MTRGIITCNLHKRRGSPSVNAERLEQHFVSGDEVEIADVVLGASPTDYYEGTPTWYKLTNGLYIWSGGVSLDLNDPVFLRKLEMDRGVSSQKTSELVSRVNLMELLVTADALPNGNGTGVVVAVLDSGIDGRHPSFQNRIAISKNFTSGGSQHPHGSQVAGTIGASDHRVQGLATGAKFIDFGVARSTGATDDNGLYSALMELNQIKRAGEVDFQVVNLSLDIAYSMIPYIKPLVAELIDQGVIVVVAGNTLTRPTYISSFDKVIPIGVIEDSQFEQFQMGALNAHCSLTFINKPFLTTSLFPSHSYFQDSSAYTALVSGLISRHISSPNPTHVNVIEFLRGLAFRPTSDILPVPFKPYSL